MDKEQYIAIMQCMEIPPAKIKRILKCHQAHLNTTSFDATSVEVTQKEFDSILQHFELLENQYKSTYHSTNETFAYMYSNVADIFTENNELREAYTFSQRSQNIYGELLFQNTLYFKAYQKCIPAYLKGKSYKYIMCTSKFMDTLWWRLPEDLEEREWLFNVFDTIEQMLEEYKQKANKPHHKSGKIFERMGELFSYERDFDRSIYYYERAVLVNQQINETSHLNTMELLAQELVEIEDFERSLMVYNEILSTYQSNTVKYKKDICRIMNAVGAMHYQLKEYDKALDYHQKVFQQQYIPIYEASIAHHSIGNVLFSKGSREEALEHHKKSQAIMTNLYTDNGKASEKLEYTLPNARTIADFYVDNDEFESAIYFLEDIVEIERTLASLDRGKSFQRQFPNYYTESLALSYLNTQSFAEAIQTYEWLIERSIGTEKELQECDNYHPGGSGGCSDIQRYLLWIAISYSELGEHRAAIEYFSRADNLETSVLNKSQEGNLFLPSKGTVNSRTILDQSLLDYYANTSVYLDRIGKLSQNDDARNFIANIILRRKGVELLFDRTKSSSIQTSDDEKLQQLYERVREITEEIQRLEIESPTADTSSLTEELHYFQNRIQGTLYLENLFLVPESEHEQITPKKTIDVKDVANHLQENELLMEWIVYEKDTWTSNRAKHLLLMTLDHNENIGIYDLGPLADIEPHIQQFRQSIIERRDDVRTVGNELWKKLILPASMEVSKHSMLTLSPDSSLHLIPFSALTTDENEWLLETHKIRYLYSGRELLQPKEAASKEPPVIIANPAFSQPLVKDTLTSNGHSNRTVSRDLVNQIYAPIPGTQTEALQIQSIFSLSNDQILLQSDATSEAVRNLHRPYFLHIATHGFFLPEQTLSLQTSLDLRADHQQIWDENPLLRSGLVFSGSNTGYEGVMTAFELATLDLQGTELVVLSACETGLGDIKSGKGLVGLRQALVVAGSNTQVLSLWRVDDSSTNVFMTHWYGLLKSGEARLLAMQNTKLAMARGELIGVSKSDSQSRSSSLSSTPSTFPNWSHPYYWAAFTVSGRDGTLELP